MTDSPVLVVVNDLFFRAKVIDAAKRAGRLIRFAQTLDEAIDKASGAGLIVLDLNCREFDTVELVRRLKADESLRAIHTLGFLSHVQEGRKREALDAGCDLVVARSVFSDRTVALLRSE